MRSQSLSIITSKRALPVRHCNAYYCPLVGEIPDQRSAFKELLPLAAQWKTSGSLLGIDKDILDIIQRNEVGANDCLHAMLSKWLKQVAPPPTWRGIVDAIEVIDQPKAQTLRQRIASTGSDNSSS